MCEKGIDPFKLIDIDDDELNPLNDFGQINNDNKNDITKIDDFDSVNVEMKINGIKVLRNNKNRRRASITFKSDKNYITNLKNYKNS